MRPARTVLVLLAALVALPLAFAQAPPAGTQPGGDGARERDSAPASSTAARERVAGEDARRCLEFPTNAQVIACAEKYRPDRRRA